MGRRQSALLLLTALAVAATSSCSKKAKLVVGVEAQPAVASRIGKLHYEAKVGTDTIFTKDVLPKAADAPPFPFEMELASTPNAQVDVTIDVYAAGPNDTVLSTKPILVRKLSAPLVPGDAKLARVKLEAACMRGTPGFKGPKCPADQTCFNGRCIDPTLLAEDLEPYAKGWAKNRPDACKPPGAGAPELTVGTGQTDYLTLKDGDTLRPELGPQGGHHLWIALKQKNLKQLGTTVIISAEQPGTGLKVPPTSFVFPFEPADAHQCKLYGLRLQIDNSVTPVASFLGKPLDVTIKAHDTDGASAEAHVHVNVDPTTLGDIGE